MDDGKDEVDAPLLSILRVLQPGIASKDQNVVLWTSRIISSATHVVNQDQISPALATQAWQWFVGSGVVGLSFTAKMGAVDEHATISGFNNLLPLTTSSGLAAAVRALHIHKNLLEDERGIGPISSTFWHMIESIASSPQRLTDLLCSALARATESEIACESHEKWWINGDEESSHASPRVT